MAKSKATDIPVWDLSRLYSGTNDPHLEADLAEGEQLIEDFARHWSQRNDYLIDPVAMLEAQEERLALQDALSQTSSRASYYVGMLHHLDERDEAVQALLDRIGDRMSKAGNQLVFFDLKIGKIKPEVQKRMLAAPELAKFRYGLSRRFTLARYDLEEQSDQLLSRVLPQLWNFETLVNKTLSGQSRKIPVGNGKVKDVAFNSLPSYMSSAETGVAEAAGKAMSSVLQTVGETAVFEINSIITTLGRISEFQGYEGPDTETYLHDDLSRENVEAMMGAAEGGFARVHEFYAFKARLMGRPKFDYYTRNVPYGKPKSDYTWDEAVALVRRVYARIDPWFVEKFEEALQNGSIDAKPRPGKTGGAFCAGPHNLPVYMMMSFTGQQNDIETLAHEFGHGLSDFLMQEHCDSFTHGSVRPMAEISSIVIELAVLEELLRDADDETKLALLMSQLDGDLASIFRQTAAMRFEQWLYDATKEQGFVGLETINAKFLEYMGAYLGPAVELQKEAGWGWINWGHLRTQFYNYSYTFACVVARALHAKVAADPAYWATIKELMGAGSKLSPADTLAAAGIDINDSEFWRTGVESWEAQLDAAMALAKRLGKA